MRDCGASRNTSRARTAAPSWFGAQTLAPLNLQEATEDHTSLLKTQLRMPDLERRLGVMETLLKCSKHHGVALGSTGPSKYSVPYWILLEMAPTTCDPAGMGVKSEQVVAFRAAEASPAVGLRQFA
jgi:hypothetical protein